MSLLGRFLGSGKSKALAQGVALLEDGRFAEAAEVLRSAVRAGSTSVSDSLASFHLRKALVSEGRRLLRAGQPEASLPFLAEAAGLWDQYPDLHFLLGTGQGLAGSWDQALVSAKSALRLNADYAEARLLQAVVLQHLGRDLEAADALNNLVESGRRIDHWLIERLGSAAPFVADNLPENLTETLTQMVAGESEKEELAAAVALCRAGQWKEGLEKFAALVEKHPRYPDYRTRLAASYFHVGQLAEALQQVEAALALNETYRAAIDLKGLILAEMGQVHEAYRFLASVEDLLAQGQPATAQEELFGAYLRAVLALLVGDLQKVPTLLAGWPDLVRNFARAELLLAALDDLNHQTTACGKRLSNLVSEWGGEGEYFFLLACHHLERGRFEDAAGILAAWPAQDQGTIDLRPRYLEAQLAVAQGRVGDLPAEASAEGPLPAVSVAEKRQETTSWPESCLRPHPAAWQFLAAKAAFVQGDNEACWRICDRLANEGGFVTEQSLRLQVLAAREAGPEVHGEWTPGPVLPESCLPGIFHLNLRLGRDDQALAHCRVHQSLHPEWLKGNWLSPDFWLGPVRSWIA